MIEIHSLTKTFHGKGHDVEAVKDVSLHVDDGEIYGIIGYSGAGKSTLVRCINFLEVPDAGSITVSGFGTISICQGRPVLQAEGSDQQVPLSEHALRGLRRSIGMIFQHFNLLDRSTVYENIAYPLQHTGRPPAEIHRRVWELLELVDLKDKADAYPCQLSGGQKQRVAIARALANNPKILLSDEATSALDPDATESILKLLQHLNQKLGLTIILITHEMAVIKAICQRVTVMENGTVAEEGDVYRIFASPQQAITKKFVNSTFGLSSIEHLMAEKSPLVQTDSISKLIRLVFEKDAVGDAIISQVSRAYQVDLNIVLANVELLQGSPLGSMIVVIRGDPANVAAALKHLNECHVQVEVIEHERTV